ncbi:OPT oligopeptide transporter [Pisolithus thermaeus]|nr:OPT oligopeptide transporter [Pisolithus thermaeus]
MVWKGNPPAAKQPRARRARTYKHTRCTGLTQSARTLDLPTDEKEFRQHSLSAEVRAAVANTDDSSIPAMTLRTWVLALAWAVITPGLNQFMFYRYPPVAISSFVLQLLSFPIGKLWARYIPRKRIFGVSLNPGPFSMKEHMIASVGAQSAYAVFSSSTDQWFLVLSTQLIGFSAGGIARRFLVSPPSMIWPPSLITCALFNALHSQLYAGVGQLGGLSRERFFLYAFLCAFVWCKLRQNLLSSLTSVKLVQALSYFSWVTWIWPDNAAVRASPLEIFNCLSDVTGDKLEHVGFALHAPYNVTRVLTDDVVSDEATYNAYTTLTPTFLHFDKQIMMQVWRSLGEQPDIHARLMSVYPQGVRGSAVYRYALPGRLIAMMMFTTWGYTTMTQALTFAADSKLGHCMKIPPRKMFWCQIVAAIVAATTQLGVQTWMFNSIPSKGWVRERAAASSPPSQLYSRFTRPYPEVFGTASIVWGVVGPALQFSSGQRYQGVTYVETFGTLAIDETVATQFFAIRQTPQLTINSPVFFNGTSLIPPATELNFVPWALVNYIFQNIIRKHNCPWWAKYNYVLSAALDSGLAVSVLVIFFTLQYPMNGMIGMDLQQWWGNFALLHFSPLVEY